MDSEKFVRKEIRELEEREYAPEGEQVKNKFDLSLNINPNGVSKKIIEKMASISQKNINHYYPENMALINEISSYTGVKKGEIMLGDGCDGCLGLIANTFINLGDSVVIPVPTFHRYEFHSRVMGGNPVFIHMNNFDIDVAEVLQKSIGAKMIFLCNPNNPTGKPIPKKVLEEIIENFEGIVVVDEALADVIKMNGFDLLEKYDNLIFVRSFSKTFGLASLRIGYLVSNEKLIKQIKKTSSPFKVNGIAQELAIEALRDKEHIKKSTDYINENRSYLIDNLNRLGFECSDSVTTNFLVDVSKIGNDSSEVVKLLNEKDILVTDASVFRVPENKYIRVAIGTELENKKFIEVMEKLAIS